MGLTKQYRRFGLGSTFGVVGAAKAGFARYPGKKNWIVCGVSDTVVVWNVSTGEKVREIFGDKLEVTCLESVKASDASVLAAAGYHDGSVRIIDLKTGEVKVTFSGHKSAVTSLAFDHEGCRLFSGSNDSMVIVWDVINESGLYKLKGHKGPITNGMFMKSRNVLITSSKDRTIKFFDLDIQHCFHTIAAHMTEVWDFCLVKNEQYLITGTTDSELRVWRLTFSEDAKADDIVDKSIEPSMKKIKIDDTDEDDVDEDSGLVVEKLGSILRAGQDRVSGMEVDENGRILTCHGNDKLIEAFLICNDEEVKKRCQKKAKKERRKIAKGTGSSEEALESIPEPTLQEEFRRLKVIKPGGKARHTTLEVEKKHNVEIGIVHVLTANNMVEKFEVNLDDKTQEWTKSFSFSHPGHRSDIRTVAFSSDNTSILSGSHESVKIWSRSTSICIRTIASGYCLSSFFTPGDRQAVVGTKKGSLQIIDVASAEVLEEVEGAHEKEIWSMCLTHDDRGFVTASADKSVKFWNFELVSSGGESKQLSVIHNRTLKLDEDALAVSLSPDGRLIAVSLLDSTVKVFFVDSLKFFLSLYGHKLPALAMDISSDSTLIVTGSADKNVKIWGLDFGDCHKSIFAHDDSVVAVKFLPNTHMFFSAGKDGKLKQWDADNFERILTLDGHHGEIWSLCVSPNAKYAVTSGHDKTLRIWERSDELVVLEDERETEREREADKELATGDARVLPDQQDTEATLPGKKTVESEKGADRLMEALELYQQHQEETAAGEKPQLPPLVAAYGVKNFDEFMAKMIELVKLTEMEQTLLVLPFDTVLKLIEVLGSLLEKKKSVEVVARMFFFLVEIHHGPLSMAKEHHPMLKQVLDLASKRVKELQDVVGFNKAALEYHINKRSENAKALELMESVVSVKEKRRKKKKKEKALQTAVITL